MCTVCTYSTLHSLINALSLQSEQIDLTKYSHAPEIGAKEDGGQEKPQIK